MRQQVSKNKGFLTSEQFMGKSRQQDQNRLGVENTSHSEVCNPDVAPDTDDYRQVLQNIRQERADGAPDNQESNSC